MKYDANEKIKVLLVGPIPPPFGGIPAYVKSLFDAKLENIDYVLFNTASPSWVEPGSREGKRNYGSLFEFGILASLKKFFYILTSFFILIWILLLDRPQIVQVFTCSYWGYWRNWIYILISNFFGKKTIFHLLGAIDLFYDEVGDFQKFLLRISLNSADCYLMQSPGLEAWAKRYSRKIVVGIWNGIDFSRIPEKLEAPPELFNLLSGPVGLTIGNLSVNKGTLEIINALKILKKENLVVNWIFIGRGDKLHYRNIVDQCGLSKNIYFAGEVSELEKWQYLYHASFYCLPSFAEGQPISIIEAMACRLPIISTKVGSIPEMIMDGFNGKVVNPGDSEALAGAIRLFVQNTDSLSIMGKASNTLCHERHNITDLHHHLRVVYFQLRARSLKREITKQA